MPAFEVEQPNSWFRRNGGFYAPTTGLLAAAASLGVAQLVAGLLGVRSPVISVGDYVIDIVPAPVKDFAIATFGTNDKLALLAGIYSMLVVFALVVGFLAWRSLRLGAVALALFALIGVGTALSSPDDFPQVALPAPIGAIAGFGVLYWLRRRTAETASGGSSQVATEPVPHSKDVDRRRFLKLSGGFAAAAALTAAAGNYLTSRLSAAASRAAVVLPAPLQRLAPAPAAATLGVEGVPPFFTPNATFYRIDTALVVPQVPAEDWMLKVTGMVDKPFKIDFQELLARPMVERDVTLTCVSNVVGGELVGTARWLGVPLRDLLEEAGVDPNKATQIVGRSVDGYTCGFPTTAAFDGRTALVAVGMNGEPLPLDHGFPARLVVAGLYGYVSATKWLEELELTTLEAFDSYWVRRAWAKQAPIKTQSRIDTPRGFARLAPGTVAIGGVAWAQTRGIAKVEVRVDGGDWNEAELGAAVNDSTWRQWVYRWNATPGLHNLTVRATDSTGAVQTPERSEPIPNGASGWHSVVVTVTQSAQAA